MRVHPCIVGSFPLANSKQHPSCFPLPRSVNKYPSAKVMLVNNAVNTESGKLACYGRVLFAGTQNCTINVNFLQHLGYYVRHYGPLWTHSCFPFEGLNGTLLKLHHGTQHVAIQVYTFCVYVSWMISSFD